MVRNTSLRVNVSSHRYAHIICTRDMEWRSDGVKTGDRFPDSGEAGRFKNCSGDCDSDRRDFRALKGIILAALFFGFIL